MCCLDQPLYRFCNLCTKCRHIVAGGRIPSYNLEYAMINRVQPEESTVEVESSHPFSVSSDLALSKLFRASDYCSNFN